jgi:hypothetical protein
MKCSLNPTEQLLQIICERRGQISPTRAIRTSYTQSPMGVVWNLTAPAPPMAAPALRWSQ